MSAPRLKSFGLSDIGLTRQNNEDVWVSFPEIGFFALADGMGGHQAGEVAAKEALHNLLDSIQKFSSSDCLELIIDLRHAIEKANQWVYNLSRGVSTLSGMGTTLCCLIWTNKAIVYAHVGDSRIYRLRNKKLELLTEDHSLLAKWLKHGKLAEECETPFPYKNVITRAIGTGPKANPEIAVSTHEEGDLFFLCTDGLTDVLSLEEMEKIINHSPSILQAKDFAEELKRSNRNKAGMDESREIQNPPTASIDLELACKRLIEHAKIKGSSDNITILTIQSEINCAKNLSGQQRDYSARSESLQGNAPGSERSSSKSL